MKHLRYIVVVVASLLSSCMRWDYGSQEHFNMLGEGVFIVNEGTSGHLSPSLLGFPKFCYRMTLPSVVQAW